jgi:hypothetical protein
MIEEELAMGAFSNGRKSVWGCKIALSQKYNVPDVLECSWLYKCRKLSSKVWGEKWCELSLSCEVTNVENILPKLGISLHISSI